MANNEGGDQEKRHPIQVVVRRTGLSADRLRAWERRYDVIRPGRSESGRRLYSDDDIEKLRLLHRAVLGGRRIGQLVDLSREELSELVWEDEREAVSDGAVDLEPGVASPASYVEAGFRAVERLDAEALEAALARALVALGATPLVEDVAAPLMDRIGDAWCAGELTPAHEHAASAVIRRVLGDLLDAAQPVDPAARLAVATPAGQAHEFGAMFAAAVAALGGWTVTYLGADLPAEDIASAVRASGARALALSIVYCPDGAPLDEELRRLRGALPQHTTIVVGGRAAPATRDVLEEIGAVVLSELSELRAKLADMV